MDIDYARSESIVAPYDIFISYRRKDAHRVQPLVEALGRQGLTLWFDQNAIEEFAPITDEIRKGLAESKALLAWYSKDYPTSRPCQMELTAAFIAAQHEGDPRRRVLVVNPEPGTAHVEPIELRDEHHASAPSDPTEYDTLASMIANRVRLLAGPMGAIIPLTPPRQFGQKLAGTHRFVGRGRDFWRIHSALHEAESAIVTGVSSPGLAQVTGLGGLGKSLLAEEYALRFGAAFPGGIFWLRALGDQTVPATEDNLQAVRADQFRAIAIDLGIPVRGLDPREVEAALARTLAESGKAFLWVVDDVGTALNADSVRAWFAPHPRGKTLLTSRTREYGALGRSIPLDSLDVADGFALLTAERQPTNDSENAAAVGIVADLGGNPLALAVAGAALKAEIGLRTFEEFRSSLADPNQDALELAAELTDMLPTGHEKSVASTLLFSLQALPSEGMDFLRLASSLAIAPVPARLVAAAFANVEGVADDGRTRQRVALALTQVVRGSLAERYADDAVGVHVLVSRTLNFHDPESARRGQLRYAAIAALNTILAQVADIRMHDELALEVIHARALYSNGPRDADLANLGAWLARYESERGAYASARALEEDVLEIRRQVLGEKHPDTLTAMANLSLSLHDQGHLASARALQERVVAIRGEIYGNEHLETVAALGNLAVIVEAIGELSRARELGVQVLEARRRILGDDHLDTLGAVNNLAGTLRLQGDLLGAKALYDQVVDRCLTMLGPEHALTLTTMGNLAAILSDQGDQAGARALEERIFQIRRRIWGTDHPDTLTSMNNLAGSLRAQGNLSAARVLLNQAMQVSCRMLGLEHPNTLRTTINLAAILYAQSELAEARALQELVRKAHLRVLGREHPLVLRATASLALTLYAQGRVAEARALQEGVVDIRRRVLGEEHLDTLASMNDLALSLNAEGRIEEAERLHGQVLHARRQLLGDEHPETLTTMGNLAVSLHKRGAIAAARTLEEQVYANRCRALGPEHPDTLLAMLNLAESIQGQGDFARARALGEQALEAARRVLGTLHSHTTVAAWNLFLTLHTTGEMAAAAHVLERDLLWLLEQDPATLSGDQLAITENLKRIPRVD